MAINRAPFNALVDDNGTGLTGSIWNKAAIAGVILDPADAAYASVQYGNWTPADASGAGLAFTIRAAQYAKIGRLVSIFCDMSFPATANATPIAISGLPFPNRGPQAGFYQSNLLTVCFLLATNQSAFNVTNPTTGGFKTNADLSGAALVYAGVYLTD